MTAARSLRIVEPLPDRMLRLMKEREQARLALAELDQEIAEGCREWSLGNGYRVVLRPEQVKRELERG